MVLRGATAIVDILENKPEEGLREPRHEECQKQQQLDRPRPPGLRDWASVRRFLFGHHGLSVPRLPAQRARMPQGILAILPRERLPKLRMGALQERVGCRMNALAASRSTARTARCRSPGDLRGSVLAAGQGPAPHSPGSARGRPTKAARQPNAIPLRKALFRAAPVPSQAFSTLSGGGVNAAVTLRVSTTNGVRPTRVA